MSDDDTYVRGPEIKLLRCTCGGVFDEEGRVAPADLGMYACVCAKPTAAPRRVVVVATEMRYAREPMCSTCFHPLSDHRRHGPSQSWEEKPQACSHGARSGGFIGDWCDCNCARFVAEDPKRYTRSPIDWAD